MHDEDDHDSNDEGISDDGDDDDSGRMKGRNSERRC
jgi:hypothetical protein